MSFEEPQEEPTAEQPSVNDSTNGITGLLANRDPLLLTVLGVALLGLALICVFGILILRSTTDETAGEDGGGIGSWFGGDEDEDPDELAERTPIPTPDVTSVAVVYEPVPLDPSQQISLTLDAPTFLDINGQSIAVTASYTNPTDIWEESPLANNTAVWTYGTIVNYVFALPNTDNYKTLLESLVQGDPIVVETKRGTEYEFIFTGSELVDDTNDPSIFAQNRPSVTLVWLGDRDADERLFIYGDYVVAEDELEPVEAPTCELGETCQLGNTRITVTGATHAVDRPEAPPGFALYLVDYTIENAGSNQLDTGLLRFILIDELGNQYSLNSLAGQAGNNPQLGGFVNVGESRQVTAGYQIPSTLSSSNLRWAVSRVDNPSQIEVVIPFTGDTVGNAIVSLQQANVSDDGTSLVITGQVNNAGQQPLIINEADISLSDGQSSYFVFSTSPSFPWTVGPGQQVSFVLTFQRPASPAATFALLNYSFELSGLR